MTKVVGRLTHDKELKLKHGIDTRSLIGPKLVRRHYPLDGNTAGYPGNDTMPMSYAWILGNSQEHMPGYTPNGTGNTVIEDEGPFGERTLVWKAEDPDATSDADGGWKADIFPVDKNKTYRFSVWVKREGIGDGSFYLGPHGFKSRYLNSGLVSLADTPGGNTETQNPYFISGRDLLKSNEWRLVVGFVHGKDVTSKTTNRKGGIYKPYSKIPIVDGLTQFAWRYDTVYAEMRSYLYYNTTVGLTQKWCYPRVDLCDGFEPTIEQLVSGSGDIRNPIVSSEPWFNTEGMVSQRSVVNLYKKGTHSLNIYNNHGVPASLTLLKGETYNNEDIYRLKMTVNDPAILSSFRNSFHSHGVYFGGFNFPQNAGFRSTINWRPVSPKPMKFGGTASNIGGWSEVPNEDLGDGWKRATQTRTGAGIATRSDSIFYSVICPTIELGEELCIDVCCPFLKEGIEYSEYHNSEAPDHNIWFDSDFRYMNTITFEAKFRENKSISIISNGRSDQQNWWGVYTNSFGHIYSHEIVSGNSTNSNVVLPLNKWVRITISIDGGGGQLVYLDDQLLTVASTDVNINQRIKKIILGAGWNIGTAVFRDLMFLAEPMYPDKINSYFKEKITKVGEFGLKTPSVVTEEKKPGYYFPLTENGKDSMGYVEPLLEGGVSYAEGVGARFHTLNSPDRKTNMLNNADSWTKTWTLSYLSDVTHETNKGPAGTEESSVISFTEKTVGRASYIYNYTRNVTGTAYTWIDLSVSVYVKVNKPGFKIRAYTGDNSFQGRVWTEFKEVPSDNKWHRIEWPMIPKSAHNAPIESLSFNFISTLHSNCRVSMCAPMMARSALNVPFSTGVIPGPSVPVGPCIALPHDMIDFGENGEKDFYVSGWIKPIRGIMGRYRSNASVTLFILSRSRQIETYYSDHMSLDIYNRWDSDGFNRLWFEYKTVYGGLKRFYSRESFLELDEWNFFVVSRTNGIIDVFVGNSKRAVFASDKNSEIPDSLITNSLQINNPNSEVPACWTLGGNSGLDEAIYRDYSFNNGSITKEEIIKEFKTKMVFKEDAVTEIKNINTLDDIE